MYATVRFNKMKVSALIDTGSAVNIISEELFNSIPYSMKSDIDLNVRDRLVLANNMKIDIVGTARVKMTISGTRMSILCYIFKTSSHPIILGAEYLKQNKIVVDFAAMTAVSKDTNVICTKRVAIPPNSEMLIWGKVQSGIQYGDQGVCIATKYILTKSLLVSKAVVTVSKDRLVPIKILNPSNDKVTINKGKSLAHFSTFSADQTIQHVKTVTDHHLQNVNIMTGEIQSDSEEPDDKRCQFDRSNFIESFNLTDSKLNERETVNFENFLLENKDIFVTPDNPDLGFTDLVQHTIILKQEAKPKYQRPYRLSPDKKEILRHHLDELLSQGIISQVDQNEELPITSPVVLVTKRSKSRKSGPPFDKDSSLSQFRFCCDFRYLNSQCETFSYAIPDLQELTESFTERTPNFISSVDLSSGFFQMKIHPNSSKYTAFNTCFGTYKFHRLPMGLSSSPNSFQLLMDKVLRGLTFRSCLCYLDDVLICSETFNQHVSDLSEVFERFRSAGLKLNPKKCSFMKKSCIFLGHHISSEGIKPPPDRVRAIQDYPSPKNVKQLRRVLGLFNWFRKFIPQYSAKTQPLTKLLKKGAVFKWTDEQECALKNLKTCLLNSDVLAFPRFNIPFYLSVDTSAKGIGYMLYQKHPKSDGKSDDVRIIRFGSKSLNHWQKSYGPTKLELLGVVTSITDCSSYLRGRRFVVECDHQALRPLIAKQLKGAIYDRWLAILQQYNFEIRYKPAAQMQVPDALSRCMKSDASDGMSSPEEADPYFPYITEQTGQIDIIDEQQPNISVNHIDTFTDLGGYAADTEEEPASCTKAGNDCISLASICDIYSDFNTMESVSLNAEKEPECHKSSEIGNDCISDAHMKLQQDSTDSENSFSSEIFNIFGISDKLECEVRIDCNSETTPKLKLLNDTDASNVGEISACVIDKLLPEKKLIEYDTELLSEMDEEKLVKRSIDLIEKCDFSPDSVKSLQRSDAALKPIINFLEHGTLPKFQKDARRLILKSADYMISNDLLYHVRNAKSKRSSDLKLKYQLVLPNVLVRPMLEQFHDSPMGAHAGIQSTIDLISENFYFDKLPSIVTSYVKSCQDCQARKITKAHTKSGIISYKTPSEPFEVWQVDLFGPLLMSQRGNTYIVSAIDMFSKYVHNVPIPNGDSMTVAYVLFDMFCQFGVCSTLISDKGSEFISACTKEVCNLLAVRQNFTPSTIHHCLGLCERTHRTLAERITPYIRSGKQWDTVLPAVTFSMNSSVNTSTKYSPFEVVFGSRPKFPLSTSHQTDFTDIPNDFHDFINAQSKKLDSIRTELKANAEKAGDLMTERCNKKTNPLKLSVGDYVYMLVEPTGQARKFQNKYNGPYIVHSIVSNHLVKLRDSTTAKVLKNEVHLDRLKIAYVRAPQPTDYFVPEVHTRQKSEEDESEVSDSENSDSLSVQPELDNDTESAGPSVKQPDNLRRSTRLSRKPVRFQASCNNESDFSDNNCTSSSDAYYKIKRVLAQRDRSGKTEYKVQFKGEPAQNAIWIPIDQLNSQAKTVVQKKTIPRLN